MSLLYHAIPSFSNTFTSSQFQLKFLIWSKNWSSSHCWRQWRDLSGGNLAGKVFDLYSYLYMTYLFLPPKKKTKLDRRGREKILYSLLSTIHHDDNARAAVTLPLHRLTNSLAIQQWSPTSHPFLPLCHGNTIRRINTAAGLYEISFSGGRDYAIHLRVLQLRSERGWLRWWEEP